MTCFVSIHFDEDGKTKQAMIVSKRLISKVIVGA